MFINKPKPCECNFCNQFYFARSRHYQYSKHKNEIYKKKLDENNILTLSKNENLSIKDNFLSNNSINENTEKKNIINDYLPNNDINEKKFTLDDLDIVSRLDSLNYGLDKISETTNLSESIVKHILNIIYWK